MWRCVGRWNWGRKEQRSIVFNHPPVQGRKKGGLGRGEEVNYKAIVAFYI